MRPWRKHDGKIYLGEYARIFSYAPHTADSVWLEIEQALCRCSHASQHQTSHESHREYVSPNVFFAHSFCRSPLPRFSPASYSRREIHSARKSRKADCWMAFQSLVEQGEQLEAADTNWSECQKEQRSVHPQVPLFHGRHLQRKALHQMPCFVPRVFQVCRSGSLQSNDSGDTRPRRAYRRQSKRSPASRRLPKRASPRPEPVLFRVSGKSGDPTRHLCPQPRTVRSVDGQHGAAHLFGQVLSGSYHPFCPLFRDL